MDRILVIDDDVEMSEPLLAQTVTASDGPSYIAIAELRSRNNPFGPPVGRPLHDLAIGVLISGRFVLLWPAT